MPLLPLLSFLFFQSLSQRNFYNTTDIFYLNYSTISLKSVNRTFENINMQLDDLNINKYYNPKKVSLVRFHSTYLLCFFMGYTDFDNIAPIATTPQNDTPKIPRIMLNIAIPFPDKTF